jgi:hypothetical protein
LVADSRVVESIASSTGRTTVRTIDRSLSILARRWRLRSERDVRRRSEEAMVDLSMMLVDDHRREKAWRAARSMGDVS